MVEDSAALLELEEMFQCEKNRSSVYDSILEESIVSARFDNGRTIKHSTEDKKTSVLSPRAS